MDIGSTNKYPSNKLSNFAGHAFALDGVAIASMEGFLQSLKFSNPEMQREVCKLVGFAAKKKGSKKNWQRDQVLYWCGLPYRRDSDDYQILLDRAYEAMYNQSVGFRKALLAASKDASFTHSIGRNKINETVLTTQEFCSRITRLHKRIHREQKEV